MHLFDATRQGGRNSSRSQSCKNLKISPSIHPATILLCFKINTMEIKYLLRAEAKNGKESREKEENKKSEQEIQRYIYIYVPRGQTRTFCHSYLSFQDPETKPILHFDERIILHLPKDLLL